MEIAKFKVGDAIRTKGMAYQRIERIEDGNYCVRDFYYNSLWKLPIAKQNEWELVKE